MQLLLRMHLTFIVGRSLLRHLGECSPDPHSVGTNDPPLLTCWAAVRVRDTQCRGRCNAPDAEGVPGRLHLCPVLVPSSSPSQWEHAIHCCKVYAVRCTADLTLPPGQGDKRVLRRALQLLGLPLSAGRVKRAIQFGSRIGRCALWAGGVCDVRVWGGQGVWVGRGGVWGGRCVERLWGCSIARSMLVSHCGL